MAYILAKASLHFVKQVGQTGSDKIPAKSQLSQRVSMRIAVASQCRELVTKLKIKTGLCKNKTGP